MTKPRDQIQDLKSSDSDDREVEVSLRKIRHRLEQISVIEQFRRSHWAGDGDIFPFLIEAMRLHDELSTVISEVFPWATKSHIDVLAD